MIPCCCDVCATLTLSPLGNIGIAAQRGAPGPVPPVGNLPNLEFLFDQYRDPAFDVPNAPNANDPLVITASGGTGHFQCLNGQYDTFFEFLQSTPDIYTFTGAFAWITVSSTAILLSLHGDAADTCGGVDYRQFPPLSDPPTFIVDRVLLPVNAANQTPTISIAYPSS